MKPTDTEPIPSKTKRILINDPWPNVVQFTKLHLERHSYQVETAESARQALAKINLCQPDLLITD